MELRQALPPALRDCRAVEVLERSLAGNRLGHGILLHGESPSQLEEIVRAIAAHLLKTERDPYNHPDCFTLRPTGKARTIKIGTKAERINGEWPLNSMRRLIIDLQKTANQGARKVAIVFEADRLKKESANAFLKTLEEPSEGSTLFLLTSRPYELLDTIRSRCLNFRIPSDLDLDVHADWAAWAHDYHKWLSQLLGGMERKKIPDAILGAYGLNFRFQQILAKMTKAAWEAEKAKLPEQITSEEKEAIEAGIKRGFRKQLFGEIEKATVRFTRAIESNQPGRLPVSALHQATLTLEKSANLLELNFNLVAALELFFLKSLRIWAQAR